MLEENCVERAFIEKAARLHRDYLAKTQARIELTEADRAAIREFFFVDGKEMFVRLQGKLALLREIGIKTEISQTPGAVLSQIADLVCSKGTLNLIVRPHLADMQHSYFEALSKGRRREATWIRIRESVRLVYVAGFSRLSKVANALSRLKMPR